MSNRTTLTLETDVYCIAKNLADSRKISLGNAIGELVRKAVAEKTVFEISDMPVFFVSENAKPFGLNEVQKAEDLEI